MVHKMASGKEGVYISCLRNVEVPKNLVAGQWFQTWDETSNSLLPVDVTLDENGGILCCTDNKKHTETFDVQLITDVRTGKNARLPKESKMKKMLQLEETDEEALETFRSRAVSIACATDFRNKIRWINLQAPSPNVAQRWCDGLMRCVYNTRARNACLNSQLEKAYMRIKLGAGKHERIPFHLITDCFTRGQSGKKLVEKYLPDHLHAHSINIASKKYDSINATKFHRDEFLALYFNIVGTLEEHIQVDWQVREEDEKLYLTAEGFAKFLNKCQRDPLLNEARYGFVKLEQAKSLVRKFEENLSFADKGFLSTRGLVRYLMSEENAVVPEECLDQSHDMSHPLSHYFVSSSHNTYLTGHQFKSKSSIEIYRQVLLSGCRSVEIDCWDDSNKDEPIVTHGKTMCSEVPFKGVIEAINDYAFKTSDYPVVLSFENHCCKRLQDKMAKYCTEIFGDQLLIHPVDEHPLTKGIELPSPQKLKRKILIKARTEHFYASTRKTQRRQKSSEAEQGELARQASVSTTSAAGAEPRLTPKLKPKLVLQRQKSSEGKPTRQASDSSSPAAGTEAPLTLKLTPAPDRQLQKSTDVDQGDSERQGSVTARTDTLQTPKFGSRRQKLPQVERGEATGQGSAVAQPSARPEARLTPKLTPKLGSSRRRHWLETRDRLEQVDLPQAPVESKFSAKLDADDELESSEEEDPAAVSIDGLQDKELGTTMSQTKKVSSELSRLVTYVQPVPFRGLDRAAEEDKSFHIFSIVETKNEDLGRKQAIEFVRCNKTQLSRVFPRGTRIDSSNYSPGVFWNTGCQFVALNFQTLDVPMQLNLGMFEYNGRTGYLLKPDLMRLKERPFNPMTVSTLDGVVAQTLSIKIISGQMVCEKQTSTQVEVELHGLEVDCKRKVTEVVKTSLNPKYNSEEFEFSQVNMPEHAFLRIGVLSEASSWNCVSFRVLPVKGLRPGYRFVQLRNEMNQPQGLASLFVYIKVGVYVNPSYQDMVDALMNPTKAPSFHVTKNLPQGTSQEETTSNTPTSACNPFEDWSEASEALDPMTLLTGKTRKMSGSKSGTMFHASTSPISNPPPTPTSPTASDLENSTGLVPSDVMDYYEHNLRCNLKDVIEGGKTDMHRLMESSPLVKDVEKRKKKELSSLRKKFFKKQTSQDEIHVLEEEEILLEGRPRKLSSGEGLISTMRRKISRERMDAPVSVSDVTAAPRRHPKLHQLKRRQSREKLVLYQQKEEKEHHAEMHFLTQKCDALTKELSKNHEKQNKDMTGVYKSHVQKFNDHLEDAKWQELQPHRERETDEKKLDNIKRELGRKQVVQAVKQSKRMEVILEEHLAELEHQQNGETQFVEECCAEEQQTLRDLLLERKAQLKQEYSVELPGVSEHEEQPAGTHVPDYEGQQRDTPQVPSSGQSGEGADEVDFKLNNMVMPQVMGRRRVRPQALDLGKDGADRDEHSTAVGCGKQINDRDEKADSSGCTTPL